MTSDRLSLATVGRVAASDAVRLPRVDPRDTTIGIVHFGIGAFHRAHQAVFTEDAAAEAGETHWGILGVTGRTDSVVRQLEPQDGLYGVLQKGVGETELRIVGSVRAVAWPETDTERVLETLASPTTHLATLTVTEKGYLRGRGGSIDLGLDRVRADLALIERELAGESPRHASATPLGLLVRGLARRLRRGAEPFSVVSCDNLADNGSITRGLVTSLVEAVSEPGARDELLDYLGASVRFPSTMVDRIAPATTDADRAEAFALTGLTDEALVVAEPFTQWVIENDFAGPRPAWEKAGAILTDDVAPYERVKLRILNATHSLLAYLGALRGHDTIAAAVADEELRHAALAILDGDILPTLVAPEGIDLAHYRDTVLDRFANPSLAHTTRQVAMDGSQKLPNRMLGTALDRLDAGHTPHGIALGVAAWISYVAASTGERPFHLDDPLAVELQAIVGSTAALEADPEGTVDRVLAVEAVFPERVRGSAEFRAAVVTQLAVVARLVGEGAGADGASVVGKPVASV
ncbi:MAG: mannitol dehydrogenase family protein [Microbacteriaceae bacterium]|nr:mannitol dehydrogenase family protein [Microbacteriaceae bacterium]